MQRPVVDFVRVGYFIPLNGPLNGHPPSIDLYAGGDYNTCIHNGEGIAAKYHKGQPLVDLTRLNKIDNQGTHQMASDKDSKL